MNYVYAFALQVILLLAITGGPSPKKSPQVRQPKRYRSPDGEIVALVYPVGKEAGFESYESRVEVRNRSGSLLCKADYSSEDGEHGFGVTKAAWTPDSQFFVYSLESSGGHQPWHSPVDFCSRRLGKILSLDDALGGAVSSPNFSVSPPDRVTVTLFSQAKRVTVRLSELLGRHSGRRENTSAR